MGVEEAKRFVSEGAKVVIGDVLDEEGAKAASALGDACIYAHLDVTQEADWCAAVETAESTFGKLDILVNNAGILLVDLIEDTRLEDYERVVRINQTGVFLGIRSAIPAMKRAQGGSIVNISSLAGMKGIGGAIAYAASKWAVRGMTKTAAIELGPYGIRVNSVHPGGIDTPMMAAANDDEPPIVTYPIARVGRPEEVAELVLWLASDKSSYSTGAEFLIDGGDMAGHMPEVFRARIESQANAATALRAASPGDRRSTP